MITVFYVSGAVAVLSTALTITRLEVVHALLYLVVSLLAVAVVFFTLGAPFVAALEVIVYAGAIMVLFVFTVMMLNLGAQAREAERRLVPPRAWIGPALLAAILLGLLLAAIAMGGGGGPAAGSTPQQVGAALFGPYALGVELASLLLTAALAGTYHLGIRQEAPGAGREVGHDSGSGAARAHPGGDPVRARSRGVAGAS